MKRIVIIGAGGHGREVAEILQHCARTTEQLRVLGFIDDDRNLRDKVVDGLPVLGDWTWFEGIDRHAIAVICAVGTPHVCRQLVQRAEALSLGFVNAISPLAHVSPLARIGRGVTVFPHVIINTGADLQDSSILNVGATISHDTRVGRYANINPGVHLAGNVTIGEGCYIGMGANVIQGRSIGSWTVVGAGAIVIRDLPSNVTAVGVPAKVIEVKKEGSYEQ